MKPVVRCERESVDRLIRRFKQKVKKTGILDECNKRRYYTKPGDRKRIKHAAAVKRLKQLQKYEE